MNWIQNKEYRRFKLGDIVWVHLGQSVSRIIGIKSRSAQNEIRSDLVTVEGICDIFGESYFKVDDLDELHCEFLSEMKDELIERLNNGISKLTSLSQ